MIFRRIGGSSSTINALYMQLPPYADGRASFFTRTDCVGAFLWVKLAHANDGAEQPQPANAKMLQFLCGIAFIRGNLAFDFCNGFRRNATAVVRYGKGPEIVTRIKRDLYPEGGGGFWRMRAETRSPQGAAKSFSGCGSGKDR